MNAVAHSPARTGKPIRWIRELASPYLKGYRAIAASDDGLSGYWFLAGGSAAQGDVSGHDFSRAVRRSKFMRLQPLGGSTQVLNRIASEGAKSHPQTGFFAGYLNEAQRKFSFLKPEPPECVVFAWVRPPGSDLHRRLVREPGSLVRKTFEYIRWLTHRPPRFVFHENEEAAMARHASMKDWPVAKREHLSRNFFIETLCWLVRSGLVRKLREEAAADQVRPSRDGR